MEATGVYWKPVFYVLEEELECWLLNARHMHNVPGRKTDMADSDWICRLVRFGLVRASFVPPRPIRELRNLTRYRRTRVEERTREAQRLDKVLQDAGVKLSSVASDILGRSGRDMLDALVAGSRDPEVLAELARGRLRAKLPQLQAALVGRFGANHALVVGEILAHIDYLDESIARLQVGIDDLIAPFVEVRDRLCSIPGVDTVIAEAVIGEIGVDMAAFPELCSGPLGDREGDRLAIEPAGGRLRLVAVADVGRQDGLGQRALVRGDGLASTPGGSCRTSSMRSVDVRGRRPCGPAGRGGPGRGPCPRPAARR